MKKLFCLLGFLGIMVSLCGCGATWQGVQSVGKGMKEDTQKIWRTLVKADKDFQEKYW